MVRGWKPCEWVPREVSDRNAFLLLFHAHAERQGANKEKEEEEEEEV